MRSKIVLLLSLLMPVGAFADDHIPSSTVVAVWECSFNDGTTAGDVASWGSSDFKKWADKNKLNVGSYLWEAVAVNKPFDEADVRWVDYYPSWNDYYAMRAAWSESGALAEEYDSMVTCGKARFATGISTGGSVPQSKEKPLIASLCQLSRDCGRSSPRAKSSGSGPHGDSGPSAHIQSDWNCIREYQSSARGSASRTARRPSVMRRAPHLL